MFFQYCMTQKRTMKVRCTYVYGVLALPSSKIFAYSYSPAAQFTRLSLSCFSLLELTRALEGGKICPSLQFFTDSGKTAARSAAIFQYLLTIELDTLCKNFNSRSPKVRSPGQVKVKNGFLILRLRSGHTRYPIGFKPSAFHKTIDTYNLYISDF